jgi:multimeric flavodoxin WrbA
MPSAESPKVLIAYFSRTGHTETVARHLADACHADVEAIEPVRNRRGLFGYLLSGFEATFERDARIRPPLRIPSDYDLVLVGTPTWNGRLSSPIRAYLTRFASSLPAALGFFATCGERGAQRALGQMQQIVGKPALAALALSERDMRGRWSVYLAEFWESVLCGWESGGPCTGKTKKGASR